MKQSDDPAAIQIAGRRVTSRVVSHIQAASRNTGISFSYLMAQASKESDFEEEAGSRTSSAAGLFQFTKGTWLQLLKQHGAAHGLADVAEQIERTPKGEYVVRDAKLRQQILDMRRDPQLSALMAGEYARDNKTWLEKALGRPVNSTDLYMAHFLGPGGAAKILKAKAADPAQPAASLVPQAAHNNRSVFYDHNHSPRSVAAVYDRVRHAIERPMTKYARLENEQTDAPTAHAHRHGHGHNVAHHGHGAARVAAKGPDPVWPFENGQWPPAYLPPVDPAAAASPSPVAEGEQVAYTDGSQSADQISAPMPPPPGSPDSLEMKSPLGRLLKDLFG